MAAAAWLLPSWVLPLWSGFATQLVLHLGKAFAVFGVGWDTWELRVFSLLQLSEWLKGTSAVVPGTLSPTYLWAVRLVSQKGSRGLHLPLLIAWVKRSKRLNQETFQHLTPVFTEITIQYKCVCIFYSTLKSQCS